MESALAGRLTSALAGRYLIERELGQGGMATVYLARDLRHDRLVALRELFYRNGDTVFAVPVQNSSGFTAGRRTMLFTGPYAVNGRHATYDVHPDGKRFVFVSHDSRATGELILVQNFFPADGR